MRDVVAMYRVIPILLLAALASCAKSGGFPEGLACADDGRCPAGQTCGEDRVCRRHHPVVGGVDATDTRRGR